MKQCPNCQTVYADDSLRFCLNDGGNLIAVPEVEAPTVRMSFDKNPAQVNVASDSVPTYYSPSVLPPPPAKKSSVGLMIVGVLGLLLLLVIGGLAAFILLRPADNKNSAVAVSPTPMISPSVAPNNETAKLREEMANLQRQLENQKKNTPAEATSPVPLKKGQTTARANSPRDGFLALRSEPDSETGYRLAKIPHGASLTVLDCPKSTNAGKIAGRWCQVVYNGQAGWAFDAFMIF